MSSRVGVEEADEEEEKGKKEKMKIVNAKMLNGQILLENTHWSF